MASSPAECWLQPITTLPVPGSCFCPRNGQCCCPYTLLSSLWANSTSLLIWWLGGNAPPTCSVHVSSAHLSMSIVRLPSPVPKPLLTVQLEGTDPTSEPSQHFSQGSYTILPCTTLIKIHTCPFPRVLVYYLFLYHPTIVPPPPAIRST